MLGTMLFQLLVSVAVATAGFLCLGEINLAFAQQESPSQDTTCMDCHLEQYHLYDRGKSYCLNETQVRCTECHRGQSGRIEKGLAHQGLIANPIINDAAVCQKCHPDNYPAKVQKFALIAGIGPTPVPYSTHTPTALVAQRTTRADEARILRSLPPGPWQAAGITFLGAAFLVIFLLTARCWQIDRAAGLNR